MISIWWLPLVFLVGTWTGFVVMAMMSMSGRESDNLAHEPHARQFRRAHG